MYRPGVKNSGPDALSRFPVPHRVDSRPVICSIQAPDLVSAQASDPYCQQLRLGQLPPGFTDESGILFFGPAPSYLLLFRMRFLSCFIAIPLLVILVSVELFNGSLGCTISLALSNGSPKRSISVEFANAQSVPIIH